MIFGPTIREIYEAHADELAPYTRRFAETSAKIGKDAFVEGLELEGRIYRPLGENLERYDALVCPMLPYPRCLQTGTRVTRSRSTGAPRGMSTRS